MITKENKYKILLLFLVVLKQTNKQIKDFFKYRRMK